MSKRKLPERMELFLIALEKDGTTVNVLSRYRGYLGKLDDFMKVNYIKTLTVEDIYDFQKYLRIRKYSQGTITSSTRVAVKYYCWITDTDEAVLTDNGNALPLKCECGRIKVKRHKQFVCPVCDKSKKIGRPSKTRNTYYRPTSDFVVDNEQCKTCKYRAADKFINGDISCNYLMITGSAKTKNKDYKLPPHCTYYERGDRIVPKDEREDEE